MIPCRKNETKFSKFRACIWSPEQFLQNRSKPLKKLLKSPFFNIFKNGLCHLDPIFMPFSKWASDFFTYKTDKVIKQFVNFHPFCMRVAKMALVTTYMLQTLKTWCHSFQEKPFYLLKIFLELIIMVKVHKIAEMCHILAYFSFYYCKSLSNTFLSWGTPK